MLHPLPFFEPTCLSEEQRSSGCSLSRSATCRKWQGPRRTEGGRVSQAMSTTLGLHRLHTGRRREGLGSLRRAWKQLPSRRGHRGEGRRLGASSQTGGFSPAAQGPHMPISRGTLWPRAPRALVGSARMGHEGSVAPCSGSSSQILWLREDPELTKHSTDRAGCPASVTSGTAILST